MVYITRRDVLVIPITMHEPAFLQLKERKAKAVQAQLRAARWTVLSADRFGNSTEYHTVSSVLKSHKT